jgi:peptidoglycan hydrolase-like protein with peptidoglycan-binding domain
MIMNIIMLAMRLLRNRDRLPDFSNLLDRLSVNEVPLSEHAVGSVEWLQESLNTLNDAELEIDGDYGPATKQAVADYQKLKDIKIDGWCGPETLALIVEELEALAATG